MLRNAEAVGTAIDIVAVLPEGRDRIAHQEEHAFTQRIELQCFKNREEVAPGLHGSEAGEGTDRPVSSLGRMPVESPGGFGNRGIKRTCHCGY